MLSYEKYKKTYEIIQSVTEGNVSRKYGLNLADMQVRIDKK